MLTITLLVTSLAHAATPQTMNYQGVLKSIAGVPFTGTKKITFKIYNVASGGSALWSEIQPTVTVAKGQFNVTLGAGTPAVPLSLPFDVQYWLGVTVDPEIVEMTPRQPLTTSPYAFRAKTADTVPGVALVDGSVTAAKLDTAYVKKSGDDMTGNLTVSGKVGIGASASIEAFGITGNATGLELGVGVAGKEGNAGKITYQRFGAKDALDIVGAGPLNNRKIHFYSEGGALFDGSVTANLVSGSSLNITGNAGIGTVSPTSKLTVIDTTPANDTPAIYGEHAFTDYAGTGVSGRGGFVGVAGTVAAIGSKTYIGVSGDASTNTALGTVTGGSFYGHGATLNYGVAGSATTTNSAGTTYGGYFNASGGTNNYGIYALGSKNYFAGNVGIGTLNPTEKLHVWGNYLLVEGGGSEQGYFGGDGIGNDLQFGSLNATVSNIVMYNMSSRKYMSVYLKDVHVMGGADLAEPFDSSEPEKPEPGMVMVIDSANPGQLILAHKAYDRKVAGIVSGANGIKPGVTMEQEGSAAIGSVPVALTGRVYARADAAYGAIEPGDLLTTSDTPGHAMKVSDHARAQGAIIGKAMSVLSEGKGLVLVLVTLQ